MATEATTSDGETERAAAPFNPLRDGLLEQRTPAACAMVIFGASGDLTQRKLLPALYSLSRDRLLPRNFSVVGFARRAMPEFADEMRKGAEKFARRRPVDPDLWESFSEGISYVEGNFDDESAYARLKAHLETIDRARGTAKNRIFYLSTQPSYYPVILEHLGKAGLIERSNEPGAPFTRVIIEKPFGHELESARSLNRTARSVMREDQTYRIDHYLGKETVQNIFVLRFANGIFEPLWNAKYIDHVQLTVAEAIGVEGRGAYFEEAGIVRDMVQNHMFQLLALMAMEPPIAFEADAVRDEKTKLLRALRPLSPVDVARDVVRGQYVAGSSMGEQRGGYLDEKGVAPGSHTETYVAMKLHIDNWRWAGVPFYVRAGKALPKRATEIAIQFKSPPSLFTFSGAPAMRAGEPQRRDPVEPNVLAIRIQPDEGVSIKFLSKVPGVTMEVLPVAMEFRYGASFGAEPPEAYERLLLDCMLGDSTLFTRGDEVEASWTFIDRLFRGFRAEGAPPPAPYAFGSWGPDEADALIARDERSFRRP